MGKIALETEKNLEILLREYFEYDFIDTKNYDIQNILEENIRILIIDDSNKNLDIRLELCKKYNINVILLATVFDMLILRKYIKEKLISDFLKKKNYQLIDESIDSLNESKEKKTKIYIDDSFVKALINPNDILYISYLRHVRKSVIKIDGNEYLSKKNLIEIENLLSAYPEFIRIERSSIININHIKEINSKKEVLIFDNNESLQLSRKILKKLEIQYIENTGVIKL